MGEHHAFHVGGDVGGGVAVAGDVGDDDRQFLIAFEVEEVVEAVPAHFVEGGGDGVAVAVEDPGDALHRPPWSRLMRPWWMS